MTYPRRDFVLFCIVHPFACNGATLILNAVGQRAIDEEMQPVSKEAMGWNHRCALGRGSTLLGLIDDAIVAKGGRVACVNLLCACFLLPTLFQHVFI